MRQHQKVEVEHEAAMKKHKLAREGEDADLKTLGDELAMLDESWSSEEEPTAAPQWGEKSRVRQRKNVKDSLNKEEQRRIQEEGDREDKDIQEYLHD